MVFTCMNMESVCSNLSCALQNNSCSYPLLPTKCHPPHTLWQTKISSIWRVVQPLENHPNKGLQLKVWKPPTSPVSLVEEPGFEPRACPSHLLLFVEPWGAGKIWAPSTVLAGPLETVGAGGSGWAAHSSYCNCIESVLCSGAGHLAPNRQPAFSPHLSSSSGTEVRPKSGLRKCLLSGVFTQTGMGLTLALKVVLACSSGPWTGLSALAGCSLQVHFVLPVRIDCVCTHTYFRVALFGVFYKSGQIKC